VDCRCWIAASATLDDRNPLALGELAQLFNGGGTERIRSDKEW
jgi:hypothetical protein